MLQFIKIKKKNKDFAIFSKNVWYFFLEYNNENGNENCKIKTYWVYCSNSAKKFKLQKMNSNETPFSFSCA